MRDDIRRYTQTTIGDRLFGWLYEWHVRRCKDCYWDKTPGAEGYAHCRMADFLWRRVLGYPWHGRLA
jgi:hypothetical protein